MRNAATLCVLALFLAWGGLGREVIAQNRDYMTIQEFVQTHPEQRALMDSFVGRVHEVGTPMESGKQGRPVRIAFVYPGKQVSDYWRRSITSFERRMDEIGVQYEMHQYFSKPAQDYRIQEQQIRVALEQDPDYLVFTLDAQKHRRVIERLLTKGRPKLILQNITTPLRAWEGKQPFFYVGFDHVQGSQMIADYLINKTNGVGAYSVLYFSRGYVSEMRGDSFIRYTDKYLGLVLKDSYYTDGDREKARKATERILGSHKMDFIYCCSTDIAMGAMDALRDANPSQKVTINGWGGGSNELEALEKGELDFTVMRMNDDNGVAMAEAIRLDLEGKEHQIPQIFSGEFVLIEKGVTSQELENLKKRAFRYSSAVEE